MHCIRRRDFVGYALSVLNTFGNRFGSGEGIITWLNKLGLIVFFVFSWWKILNLLRREFKKT